MEFTGERYVPNLDWPEISYEHWHRYLYASQLAEGKYILDIACGEGYGSDFLACRANKVLGVDISPEVVRHASAKYSRPNLEFRCGPAGKLPIEESHVVDLVVSFETIEHLEPKEQQQFLQEVKRVLTPEGLFLVSTPNKQSYSDSPNYKNPYHLKEFYVEEFQELLRGCFRNIQLFGQKVYPMSYIWPLDRPSKRITELEIEFKDNCFQPIANDKKSVLYVLGLCFDQHTTEADGSLLVDVSEQAIVQRLAQLAQKEQVVQNLSDQLNREEGDHAVQQERLAAERQEEIEGWKTQLAERDRDIGSREAMIGSLQADLQKEVGRYRSVVDQLAQNQAAMDNLRAALEQKSALVERVCQEKQRAIEYLRLVQRIKDEVNRILPPHAKVLVVSKGDSDLLHLGDRMASHFPQDEAGTYAGHHPGDSGQAIMLLESLRSAGAQFFLVPSTAFWWLDHYVEFAHFLDTHFIRIWKTSNCQIYQLLTAPWAVVVRELPSQPQAAGQTGNDPESLPQAMTEGDGTPGTLRHDAGDQEKLLQNPRAHLQGEQERSASALPNNGPALEPCNGTDRQQQAARNALQKARDYVGYQDLLPQAHVVGQQPALGTAPLPHATFSAGDAARLLRPGGEAEHALRNPAESSAQPTEVDTAARRRHDHICIITRHDLQPTIHGGAVAIVRIAESLSRLGAAVYIVTNDRSTFFIVRDGRLERHKYPQTILSLSGFPDALKTCLLQFRLPTYGTWIDELLGWLGYPRDERFAYQALADVDLWLRVLYMGITHEIDVYQAVYPGYAIPAALAAKLLGGLSVLVEHNVEYHRLRDTCQLESDTLGRIREVELACARIVDSVVTVSAVDRELLAADGVPPDSVAVIPNGVSTRAYHGLDRARVRTQYGIPSECPLLVFHGTLSYPPNSAAVRCIVQDLLPGLQACGIKAKALICGVNPPRELGSPDVIFPGAVDDLPDHLVAADLAVVPLDAGGGTRLKILEYFAAGLPVVSTTKGAEGIPARTGVEIEIADGVEALVTTLAGVLRDPQRASRLGQAGRAFVQTYDWDRLARQYLELYGRGRSHLPAVPPGLLEDLRSALRAPEPIL